MTNENIAKLNDLEIIVAGGEDGKLTVYSTSEPLFCFVRSTEAEVLDVVKDTLHSYIKHFRDENVEVTVEVTIVQSKTPPLVREVRLEPRQRLFPSFSFAIGGGELAYA